MSLISGLPGVEEEASSVQLNTTVQYQRFFHSPTDEQMNCLKNNFKIYIKFKLKQFLHVSVQSP
jgi:hypothetical protein